MATASPATRRIPTAAHEARPALVPADIAPDVGRAVDRDLSLGIEVGARPVTVEHWRRLLRSVGFEVVETIEAPMHLLEPRRIVADEGAAGAARFARNRLRDRGARRRVLAMRRLFRCHRERLSAVAIVARKPPAAAPDVLDLARRAAATGATWRQVGAEVVAAAPGRKAVEAAYLRSLEDLRFAPSDDQPALRAARALESVLAGTEVVA